MIDGHDYSSVAAQRLRYDIPIPCRNSFQIDNSIPVGNAHHHIGVVDGCTVLVNRIKDNRSIPQLSTKIPEQLFVGTRRLACVSQASRAVEYEAPGPFEESAFGFVPCEINLLPHRKPACYGGEYRLLALPPPIFRKHGVEHHRTVAMERHPIIWENAIRCMRIGTVLYHHYI